MTTRLTDTDELLRVLESNELAYPEYSRNLAKMVRAGRFALPRPNQNPGIYGYIVTNTGESSEFMIHHTGIDFFAAAWGNSNKNLADVMDLLDWLKETVQNHEDADMALFGPLPPAEDPDE